MARNEAYLEFLDAHANIQPKLCFHNNQMFENQPDENKQKQTNTVHVVPQAEFFNFNFIFGLIIQKLCLNFAQKAMTLQQGPNPNSQIEKN